MKNYSRSKIVSNVAYLFVFFLFSAVTVSSQIKIENKIRKDVPLEIEVRNADTTNWVKNLEVKVTNTGTKPIYYLSFYLVFEDVKTATNEDRGFPFNFGSGRFISVEELSNGNDVAIKPTESYTFTIHENFAKSWEIEKSKSDFIEPKFAYFRLGSMNFGDGTGRDGGGNPTKKKVW